MSTKCLLLVLYFSLNASSSFSISVLNLLPAPDCMGTLLVFDFLESKSSEFLFLFNWISLFLKSFLSYASQADCLFWRAELAFYVSVCLLQSCPTPTWSSINIPEKKKCFLNPILQGSKGLFYVQSSEIKKPNPSKIASFCILHFDDVSKVWFSIFFMLLIYSKLPYISVVPNRKEVTCKGTGPPVT